MIRVVAILSSLFVATSAWALDVDSAQTQFNWTGTKVTGKHFGTLPLKSSKVTEKDGKVTGGEFIIDITGMTVTDLEGEYKEKFLSHMKSPDFFEVEKWPTAKLVITKMDGKVAHGQLTIKDKTNDVKIPYTQKGNVYQGTFKFDRTKYGMIYGSGNFFKNLGDKMIHNDVTLEFKVAVK